MTSSGAAINNPHDLSKDEKITAEVNEVFLNQELIKKKSLTKNKTTFELEILIPKTMLQIEKDISILINITENYPKEPPEVLCLTEFLYPNICDGRNLISGVLGDSNWNLKNHNIDFLVNKIPKFIISFIEMRKKNSRLIVGNFELNKLYHMNRLKELPVFFHLITLKEKKMQIKTVKSPRILTISDISFCLFELDSKNSGYCKLVFHSDLKDLITTKINEKKNEIEIKWKSNTKNKKEIKIEIISPMFQNINKLLTENFKKFTEVKNSNIGDNNINKDVSKKNDNKDNSIKNNNKDENKIISSNVINKDNSIKNNNTNQNNKNIENINIKNNDKNNNINTPVPNVNIAMIEKQIFYVEKSMNVNGNVNNDQIKYLTTLYQKCFEYYEAIKSPKANDYKNKIGVLTGKEIYISNEKEENDDFDKKEDNKNEINMVNEEKKTEEIKNREENIKEKNNLENEKFDFDFGNDFNNNNINTNINTNTNNNTNFNNFNFNFNENDTNNVNVNNNLTYNSQNEINNPNNEKKDAESEVNNDKINNFNNINNNDLKNIDKKEPNKEENIKSNDKKTNENNVKEEKLDASNENQIHLKVMNEGEEVGTLDVGSDDDDD